MRRKGVGSAAVWACAAAVAAILLSKHSQTAAKAVYGGLALCGRVMIPSLFPFMVISELLVRTGAGRRLSRLVRPLLAPLLRLSEAGCCAFLLGALCGFPVGARTAAAYWRSGQMSDDEFRRVICFCHMPSTAFLVGTVGAALLGSAAAGRVLLLAVLLTTLATGLWLRGRASATVPMVTSGSSASGGDRGASLLSRSVASAAEGMLNVCATVLLFSALVGTLKVYAEAFRLPPLIRVLLLGALEMSTGVCEAATLSRAGWAFVSCAALVGFGGVSVQCQILAVCEGCPVPQRRFWLSRLLQGGGCALVAYLALRLGLCDLPASLLPPWQEVGATVWEWQGGGVLGHVWSALCAAVLLMGLAQAAARAWQIRRGDSRRE